MADQLNTTAPSGRLGFINFDLVGAALLHTRLEKSCRWVLVALCSYANLTQHRAWPSVASLARRAGCSERTAQSRLRQLERAGYIHAVHNGQHSTVAYQIAADKLLHELSGSTSAAPPFAPAKTAPPSAKPVVEGVQMPHPKKQGEETTENRKEDHAHAQATALAEIAARTSEPIFPVLTSEGIPDAVPCPAPVTVVMAAAPAVAPVTITPAVPSLAAPTPAPNPVLAREQAEATRALPSGTLERLNTQRKANGKGALTPRDLAQLHREAAQAGLTPLDAAQWVLAKPQRNFFKADFYAPPVDRCNAAPCSVQSVMASVAAHQPTAQHPAAPVTLKQAHKTETQPRTQEHGNAHERVRELLAQLPHNLHRHHNGGNGHRTTRDTASTTGHTSPARDTRWASAAVEQFAAGHAVSHYRLKVACEVLGIDLRALRQRAMATPPMATTT